MSDGSETESIEVPDVSANDGAQAVSDVDGAGLQATLADVNDDPSFDTSRDARDCEVTDQNPVAGEPASEGDEVIISVDCSQVDWENQDGPEWEAFDDAYISGFDAGCHGLFDQSPNGSLYEDDTEYTVTDCQNVSPADASDASDVPTDVPDDPDSAGDEVGQLDGCQALFTNQGVLSLNYGTDSYTDYDCPVGAVAATSAGSKTKTSPRSPSTSSPPTTDTKFIGQRCAGKQTDGAPVVLSITKGKIKCSGAVALLDEWLRRAPKEGSGSGARMELYGWSCIGAPAAQPNRIGSCQRSGADAAAFTATIARGQ